MIGEKRMEIEADFIHKASKKRILVVGDIMLDKYLCVDVERISPEAPVPIAKITKEYYTLGGCGNVIRNISELGFNVTCVAAVGNDKAGRLVLGELTKLKVDARITVMDEGPTTQKTRIVANTGHAQMLRVDKESTGLIKRKFNLEGTYDIIVISDYNKGMITAQLMSGLRKLNVPIIVDPKPQNMWLYNDVFMITPNKKEYDEICISTQHPFTQGIRYILKTLGKDGMDLMDEKDIIHTPAIPVDVFNVTGAGDTVIAVMAMCLSLGIDVEAAAAVANVCARYVVTQPDTSVVPKSVFYNALYNFTRK